MSPLSPSIPATQPAPGRRSERAQGRQIAWITAAAIALFVVVRLLPTGTNLSHVDFNVSGGNSIEFCDPKNPQFIPVVSVRSPVAMVLSPLAGPPLQGEPVKLRATLTTSTGKSISPKDLFVTHTEKLHLLIFDPELGDYQHVHPTPGSKPGQWDFSFTPHRSGLYRIFADFTPIATGRWLYANADLDVRASAGAVQDPGTPLRTFNVSEIHRDGWIYRLASNQQPLRARQVADFSFSVAREDGKPANLEPVMDAFAHLVAVDRDRTGFAHLHPSQLVTEKNGEVAPAQLAFKVLIPKSGQYVIWAQIRAGGQDHYVPFWFEVS